MDILKRETRTTQMLETKADSTSQSGSLYDAYYYAHGCGQDYGRTDNWLRFFRAIADRIISDINPGSVLDAGCAVGLLVESLRRRGVTAYGIDISDYAIQQIHPEIRSYCWVGSITESFPQKYDLIVTIEVVEHMSRENSELAIANLCQHSDDILFSSSPMDYKEVTHFNVQPPEYWAEMFARHGFFRDVDFDATFITPWAVRFRRMTEPIHRIVGGYERRLWYLLQDNQGTRAINLEQRHVLVEKDRELHEKDREIGELLAHVAQVEKRWEHWESSASWKVMLFLQRIRAAVAPPDGLRDKVLQNLWLGIRSRNHRVIKQISTLVSTDFQYRLQRFRWKRALRRSPQGNILHIPAVQTRPPARPHPVNVDIILYVHNALDDVQSCLQSVFKHTAQPYTLILVDDGSDAETHAYLTDFVQYYGAILLSLERFQGYHQAVNQALRTSMADYVVLLNSDTIVTEAWLDRMVACAESDPRIGIVGPLSNAASWQSIPEVGVENGSAFNYLPQMMTIDEMGTLVKLYSGHLYPRVPSLNGFCRLLKRALLEEVGFFAENKPDSLCIMLDDCLLHAKESGWYAAIADDVYLYRVLTSHHPNESDQQLASCTAIVANKHRDDFSSSDAVDDYRYDRVLEGIRARVRASLDRQEFLRKGRVCFAGRKILFVLPVTEPGGGGNVIIDEALAMRKMGVDVSIFNRMEFRQRFEKAYPELQLPVIYGAAEDLVSIADSYEAVVASVYFTVEWLKPLANLRSAPILGYYVQGFEPYIYESDDPRYQQALDSYTLIPNLKLFSKTTWTCDEVYKYTNIRPSLIGVSQNIDLFRPRPPQNDLISERPLRIAAMIRPSTPYRSPKLTMDILRQASRHYQQRVEIWLFGVELEDVAFGALPHDFPWSLAGILTQKQVARFFNEIDVFVDFSSHQAMGLTALEAMASGVAVIVPKCGGATEFALHEKNSLVVDTSSRDVCWQSLQRLVEDHQLRISLQRAAIHDVAALFPERAAFNILHTLFASTES